jgi:hypothetical protein
MKHDFTDTLLDLAPWLLILVCGMAFGAFCWWVLK